MGYTDDIEKLDADAQINILGIGKKIDTVDGWYGAMGNSTLKVCVRGTTSQVDGRYFFNVVSVGFYLKDTYDFVDEGRMSEPLGIWSRDRILNKAESILYMNSYASDLFGLLVRQFSGFVPVFNSDFRSWQERHNTGADFIILSDVYWMNPI
nr:DUF6402 family protein [Pantoea sp. S61]